MNRITATAALALSASAAPRLGRCPKDYSPMETFDVNRYAGEWYEISRDKYFPFEILSGCEIAKYTVNEDGTVGVDNKAHRFI